LALCKEETASPLKWLESEHGNVTERLREVIVQFTSGMWVVRAVTGKGQRKVKSDQVDQPKRVDVLMYK